MQPYQRTETGQDKTGQYSPSTSEHRRGAHSHSLVWHREVEGELPAAGKRCLQHTEQQCGSALLLTPSSWSQNGTLTKHIII